MLSEIGQESVTQKTMDLRSNILLSVMVISVLCRICLIMAIAIMFHKKKQIHVFIIVCISFKINIGHL